jgi:adenylyltransferase/sulfurtransferase
VKPLLPKQYRLRLEPAREPGDRTLVLTSEGKRISLAGLSLETFVDRVVPLLDGNHTLEEIQSRVADVFDPSDLAESLRVLNRHGIVEDTELVVVADEVRERIEPELGYLRSVTAEPARILGRLSEARVTVVGLGAIGAVAATALAAANVGRVRCVDGTAVLPTDPFLAQLFSRDDVGRNRAEVTRERIAAVNPTTAVEVITAELRDDGDLEAAISGSDFVLGCVDPGLGALMLELNRLCLTLGVSWSSARVSAFEGIVGPTVIPAKTACYLCYLNRALACSYDPGEALADLKQQAESKSDASGYRENLPFGAGIVGNLLALEAFTALTSGYPQTAGRILTIEFATGTTKHHLVLRKPTCPACFPPDAA